MVFCNNTLRGLPIDVIWRYTEYIFTLHFWQQTQVYRQNPMSEWSLRSLYWLHENNLPFHMFYYWLLLHWYNHSLSNLYYPFWPVIVISLTKIFSLKWISHLLLLHVSNNASLVLLSTGALPVHDCWHIVLCEGCCGWDTAISSGSLWRCQYFAAFGGNFWQFSPHKDSL